MPVIKTWTKEAYGIEYHPIGLAFEQETQTLKWSRSYHYLDENGEIIKELDGQMFEISHAVRGEMAWADVPQKVKDALVIIDAYTKQQIKAKEGIG